MKCIVAIAFLASLVTAANKFAENEFAQKTEDWFEDFHDHDDIIEWTIDLARTFPDLVTLENIGESLQGRPMNVLRITIPNGVPNKPQLYYEGLIHAREWISGGVTQYITHYLITNAYTEARVTSLLERMEVLVLMMTNPDGYSYSRTNDRNWRKNRKPNANGSIGVDMNRNFDDKWGVYGSTNPSSGNFQGVSPASEIEVQNIQNFFLDQGRIIVGIDYHCCGQMLNRPFGWTTDDAVGEDDMRQAGALMQEAIRSVNGRTYTNQKSIYLYTTSATSKDWFNGDQVKNVTGIRAYGYVIELPTEGNTNGELIASIGQENFEGFMQLANYAYEHPINY